MSDSYAIIDTGGKQYRVSEGDELNVELLHQEGSVTFEKVVFFTDGKAPLIGEPHVSQCKVHGDVLGLAKGPKEIAFKYKKRKNYRRTVGHRQKYTRVKITKIAVA